MFTVSRGSATVETWVCAASMLATTIASVLKLLARVRRSSFASRPANRTVIRWLRRA
jgi:hypothetical protein